jgi:CheY-like chemotaxis protein
MLQNLSDEVWLCYGRAEDCARRTTNASNETLCAYHIRREQRWLGLARRHELEQRPMLFSAENGRCKMVEDRSIGPVPMVGTAAVNIPGLGKADNDPQHLHNELVAIVDDDEYARSGLSALIKSLGHRTAMFASAEEYLASDMSESPACLILDVHLPGMSGPDLQGHLITDAHYPPIVFVTGRFEEHVRKRVTEAGALGYLTKPCYEKALLNCIGKVLCGAA